MSLLTQLMQPKIFINSIISVKDMYNISINNS